MSHTTQHPQHPAPSPHTRIQYPVPLYITPRLSGVDSDHLSCIARIRRARGHATGVTWSHEEHAFRRVHPPSYTHTNTDIRQRQRERGGEIERVRYYSTQSMCFSSFLFWSRRDKQHTKTEYISVHRVPHIFRVWVSRVPVTSHHHALSTTQAARPEDRRGVQGPVPGDVRRVSDGRGGGARARQPHRRAHDYQNGPWRPWRSRSTRPSRRAAGRRRCALDRGARRKLQDRSFVITRVPRLSRSREPIREAG